MDVERDLLHLQDSGEFFQLRAIVAMDVELPRRVTMDVNPLRSVIREMSPPRVTMREVTKEETKSTPPTSSLGSGGPLRVIVREVRSPASPKEVSPPRVEESPPRNGQRTVAMPPLLVSNQARWVCFGLNIPGIAGLSNVCYRSVSSLKKKNVSM